MTLILTFAAPNYLLQVSDRMVSRSGQPFEEDANKNIIYQAKNAVVTIGYSGLAYLEGVATDRWIAQRLRGETFFDFQPGQPGAIPPQARAPRWLDIGRSVELLRHDLAELFAGLEPWQRERIEIAIAGWQWRRKHRSLMCRPILCSIENGEEMAARHRFKTQQVPRNWHYRAGWPLYLSSIPTQNDLSKRELSRLEEALRDAAFNPNSAAELLVAAVRRAARRSPKTVGADCMSIYMPTPSLGVVEAKYLANDSQQGEHGDGKSFSPWVVGPYSVIPPAEIVGDHYVGLGPVTVSLAGSSSVAGWHFPPDFPGLPDELKSLVPDEARVRTVSYFSSQKRKGYP